VSTFRSPSAADPTPPLSLALWSGLLLVMITFASASVAVILPEVVVGLHVSAATGAWVISAYMLVLAVCTGLYGRLSDIFGIRGPLVAGTCVLAAGSVLAALAPSFGVLMVARVVQAVGAASLPSLVITATERLFAATLRERALATVTGLGVAVGSVGPLIGGTVAHVAGWRVALALPVIGMLAIVPVWRWLPTHGSGARVDVVGALFVVLVAAGVVVLLQAPGADWPAVPIGLASLAVGLPLLRRHVLRRPAGFVPLEVARDRTMLVLTIAASTVPSTWFALMLILPITLAGMGWSAWQVGLAMTPSALSGLLSSRVTPGLVGRWGPVRCMVWCCVVAALSLALCAVGLQLSHVWATPLLLVLASFLTTGFAATCQSALISLVGKRFDLEVRGAAMGISTLVFLLGAAFGAAAQGGLSSAISAPVGALLLALLPVAGAVLAARRSRLLP
jgi:MFS family permease